MNKCRKILSFLLCFGLLLGITQPAFAKTFTDIQGHWGQKIIEDLAEKGIINGETPKLYNPEGQVTRAQFIKLLACALTDKFSSGKTGYSDIDDNFWAKDYIVYAQSTGILTDAAGSKFDPDRAITRNEAAIWLGRTVTETDKKDIPSFTDQKEFQNFTEAAYAIKAGIMQGNEDGSFAPRTGMTRAEAAAVISRLMTWKETKTPSPTPATRPQPSPEPETEPEPNADTAEDVDVKPVRVAMGRNFTLMLKNDGTVWSSGSNRYGQLGYAAGYEKLFDKEADINANFQPIKELSNIKAVYAAEQTGFAIDSGGTVWSWGSNNKGELGNAAPDESGQITSNILSRFTPKKIDFSAPIIELACGTDHIIALTNNGEVFAWGANHDGQLGMGDQSKITQTNEWDDPHIIHSVQFTPFKIEELGSDVTAVSAEKYGNLALKKNGDVWTWGAAVSWVYKQKKGDASILSAENSRAILAARPTQIAFENQYKNRLINIKGIAAGRFHATALTQDGSLLSWGSHEYGQLGCGDNTALYENDYIQKVYFEPNASYKKMNGMTRQLFDNVKQIESVGDFTAALRNDGSVWIWGLSPIDVTRRSKRSATPSSDPFHATHPYQIKDVENVTELCAGYQDCDNLQSFISNTNNKDAYVYKVVAIKSDGTVWNIDYQSTQIFDLNE